VAVLGILLGGALPSMSAFIARQRVISAANELIAGLHLARTFAVTHHRQTSLCPSADLIICNSEPDWGSGWLVFDDANRNREHDADEVIYRAHQRTSAITIRTPRSRRRIRFRVDGSAPGTNVTFTVCSSQGTAAPTAFILSNTGRVRHSDEGPSGRALNCEKNQKSR